VEEHPCTELELIEEIDSIHGFVFVLCVCMLNAMLMTIYFLLCICFTCYV
jgi:hypothetical protein